MIQSIQREKNLKLSEQGSASVELVLIVPILLLFILVTIGLGRLEIAHFNVDSAVRAAAENSSSASSAAQAQVEASQVSNQDLSGLGKACVSHSEITDVSDFKPGGWVQVTITCRVSYSDILIPGLPGDTTITESLLVPVDPYRSVSV